MTETNDAPFTQAQWEELVATIDHICQSNYWSWDDMQRMEKVMPGVTQNCGRAYGVTPEVWQEILQNGKGFYMTPDLKEFAKSIVGL